MYITSATLPVLGLVLSGSLLSGCGSEARGDVPTKPVQHLDSVVQRAPEYVGDPWERRFREQFWADQHIHDSWNECHIGENVPQRLQRGDDCRTRLPGHTSR